MAMACDLVISSETAKFHQSFKRIGLVPDGGAVFFLMKTLGPVRAKELVYFAKPLEAAEAFTHGFVNRVVPDAELEAEANRLATELASGPTLAFGLTKQLFRTLDQPRLEAFLEVEAWVQGLAMLSADHQEGAAAFREKREPKFTGN
jgi:2-(1,2-epoxy-1,2-dihydrophenyl)acetyl-CoA isomerase